MYKKQIDLESACSEESVRRYKIKMKGLQAKLQGKTLNVAFATLFLIVWRELLRQTDAHTDIKIVITFA